MHNPSAIKGTPLGYFCCILCGISCSSNIQLLILLLHHIFQVLYIQSQGFLFVNLLVPLPFFQCHFNICSFRNCQSYPGGGWSPSAVKLDLIAVAFECVQCVYVIPYVRFCCSLSARESVQSNAGALFSSIAHPVCYCQFYSYTSLRKTVNV